MTQQHRVTWGEFDLDMDGPDPVYGFRVETMADGTSMGNPVRLVEVVKSLLTDGSLVEQLGFDNRELPIRLRFSAPAAAAGPALAAAERLLSVQTQGGQFPPLSYTPPADLAAVCVFDVLNADLQRDLADGWDFEEVQHEYRYYVLTFSTHPHPRDADPVTVAALPLPPPPEDPAVWVDIDTCDSISGWSRETSGGSPTGPTAVTVSGDTAVQVSAYIDHHGDHLRLVRTGAVSMGATPYLAVDVRIYDPNSGVTHVPWAGPWRADFDGAYYDPLSSMTLASGRTRLFFQPPTSFSAMKVLRDFAEGKGGHADTHVLQVFNIARTNAIGDTATSTSRQQSRLAQVGGSAPTQAAVQLVARTEGTGLGDVLIYTSGDPTWSPPLRRLIDDSADVSADSSKVSGGFHSLTAAPTRILIPAAQIAAGMYDLLARLSVSAGPAALTWEAKMVDAAGDELSPLSDLTITETITLDDTADYQILSLNSRSLALPVRRVGDDQQIELTLSAAGGVVLMDEGWLFAREGALTWIRGLGDMSWAEIQPVRLGEDALRHDAGTTATIVDDTVTALAGRFGVDDLCASVALHDWPPGERYIFTVQTSALVASSWITYYRRFHSHVEALA